LLIQKISNFEYYSKETLKLIENSKYQLKEFLISQHISDEIIKIILDDNFINNNPKYYLYYPYLFKEYFPSVTKEYLNMLSVAGYLYFRATLLMDQTFDNKTKKSEITDFIIVNVCQEESLKILSSFFDKRSEFWSIWQQRKSEYLRAYLIEKKMTEINDFSEYENLADLKSTFGKIAIDCLYHLENNKNYSIYSKLLESHKYFYTTFQIIDDISDYSEDLINDQFNISNFYLKKHLQSHNRDYENLTIADQKKTIYYSGIVSRLYKKAVLYTQKSQSVLNKDPKFENNTSYWLFELSMLNNKCISNLLNVDGYIARHNSIKKHSHSNTKNLSIIDAVEKGYNFLYKKQQKDGSWIDMLNDAGASDTWTTAFVISSLSNLVSDKFNILKKGKDFLKINKYNRGLWGYNKNWIDDADSSSFSILSIFNSNDNRAKESINLWLKYQNEDGGFSTYRNRDLLFSSLNSTNILKVDGWLQSHFCVSAVAYYLLVEFKQIASKAFKILENYIIHSLKVNSLKSYWWSNDYYALYYILEASLKIENKNISSKVEDLIEKNIYQLPKLNNFYKGFFIKSICISNRLYDKYQILLNKIMNKMLSDQFDDGSWKEGFSLKIPHPTVINSCVSTINYIKSDKGTNILAQDFNRIFSTTSVLSALLFYEKRLS
jgi:hypothetical protein